MKLVPTINGKTGIPWMQLVDLPSEANEDGSAPAEGALADLIANEYFRALTNHRDAPIEISSGPGFAPDFLPTTIVTIGRLVTGQDRDFARAFMNAICGLMHWVEPYEPQVVWSDPMRRCVVCSNYLGEHPQSDRKVERIGPDMDPYLAQACNGTLLDFGGWMSARRRASIRKIERWAAEREEQDARRTRAASGVIDG